MGVIEIKWRDAKVFVDPTDNFDLPIMTSIGFLMNRDKNKVLLASLIGTDGEPRVVTAIPTVLIVSEKKLK